MQESIVIRSGRVCNRVYLLIICRNGEMSGWVGLKEEDKDTGIIKDKREKRILFCNTFGGILF